MSAVPRLASFDDLRVGQWVAVFNQRHHDCDTSHDRCETVVEGGQLERRDEARFSYGSDAGYDDIYAEDCNAGEVIILRDAPAPPVTVRREDYDALRDRLDRMYAGEQSLDAVDAIQAARTLIDHADLGDTP